MPRFRSTFTPSSWLALESVAHNATVPSLWAPAVELLSHAAADVWQTASHVARFGDKPGGDEEDDWIKKAQKHIKPDSDWWADDKVKLFRSEDTTEWIVFTVAFIVLIIFDNWVLHRDNKPLKFGKAFAYTLFWVSCAGCFNLYVYYSKGLDAAFTWATGYLLEWMLSVDNLFVFHLIFKIYQTPESQMHKPLFYGIVGAIVFRMMFFVVEEALFHSFWWAKIVFGLFLIYTGVQAAMTDEDEEDPSQNPLVIAMSNMIPMVRRYDESGRFFIYTTDSDETTDEENAQPGTADGEDAPPREPKLKATMLVAVVLCLEVTDVVFAVDSVSAIVAQVPDLFLAYTACVFAMLGLRAMFFMVNNLISMFKLLKYGVAVILIFIGIKLLMHSRVHFSTGLVLAILVGAVVLSLCGSMCLEAYQGEGAGIESVAIHDVREDRKLTRMTSKHSNKKETAEVTEGTQTTPSLKKMREKGVTFDDSEESPAAVK
eukprot:TRINITY_DN6480_c0_g1_i1.p1 TRINITY_DN6480_c0_g1~~TRINITY_DN6480_c0_g1_i1.p1  ORF type:complete len:486 (-),score=123.24 TRINITY_DN6480_c0_g1_i1:66-1523(-)